MFYLLLNGAEKVFNVISATRDFPVTMSQNVRCEKRVSFKRLKIFTFTLKETTLIKTTSRNQLPYSNRFVLTYL